MHHAALEFLRRTIPDLRIHALDLGGRNVNGSIRDVTSRVRWTVLDAIDAPDVDVVADAATWEPDRYYDMVVCAEVFEHTAEWPAICRTAYRALIEHGRFVVTCAGPGRAPHSGIDGAAVREGEHYENIDPDLLARTLDDIGFTDVDCWQTGDDVQATATR